MKKSLIIIVVLVSLLATPLFAQDMQWSLNVGTGVVTSNVGVGLTMGQLQFKASVYTGFPNIAIITYADNAKDPNFSLWEVIKGSFLFGGVNLSAAYDIIAAQNMDLSFGLSLAGSKFPDLGIINGLYIIGVHATVDYTMYFGSEAKNGFFLGAELPLANYAGTKKNPGSFIFVGQEGWTDMIVPILFFSAKVGYTHKF